MKPESKRRRRAAVPGLAKALGRGRRTFLRYPERRDEAAFRELVRASRAFHAPWFPARQAGRPDRDSAEAFAGFLAERRTETHDRTLLCRLADGAPVGVFNLNQIHRGPLNSAYLGYWVGAEHAGHGYMRDGLPLLVRHAFRDRKLHRIEANIQPHNAPSIALVRGAGFRKEGFSPRYLKIAGRWRDHERWALLADDPR